MGKKYNICYKAFQSVYDISRYKRKVLLSEVKDGIKNSENGLTEWSKVHDATLQSISAYLRSEVNDLGFSAKEIITNIICPNTEKTHKVSFSRNKAIKKLFI
jgi:hypothetical protein